MFQMMANLVYNTKAQYCSPEQSLFCSQDLYSACWILGQASEGASVGDETSTDLCVSVCG